MSCIGKSRWPGCCLGLLAGAPALVWSGGLSADTGLVELTVRVTGIEQARGAIAIAIFDEPAHYEALENPVAKEFVPATDGVVSWSALLSAGSQYAAVVYHDVNGNGELDKGRFGIPKEPYGFSNDARSPFGPPGFDAARFELTEIPLSISIEIK